MSPAALGANPPYDHSTGKNESQSPSNQNFNPGAAAEAERATTNLKASRNNRIHGKWVTPTIPLLQLVDWNTDSPNRAAVNVSPLDPIAWAV